MEMQEVLEQRIDESRQHARERQFIDLQSRATPLPPAVIEPPRTGWQRTITCRRCGAAVTEAHWNYCPNCGQRIKHYSYAGARGWSHSAAEKDFKEMMEAAQ